MFFFFKQKTAYEMRISDWSSDVCSSDLHSRSPRPLGPDRREQDDEHLRIGPESLAGGINLRQYVGRREFRDMGKTSEKLECREAVRPIISASQRMDQVDGENHQEIGRASCRERVCQDR